jgi:sulfoxide reductase heme-binding subunit YedZ
MAAILRPSLRLVAHLFCIAPFVLILVAIFRNSLGPDPADELAVRTGEWALKFLIFCLCVTPIRRLFVLQRIAPLRRLFGLYSFFYSALHCFVYVAFLLQFRWMEVMEDVAERPYITVGLASFCILLVLALTSPRSVVKRLGRRWSSLHKLVYVAAVLALLHQFWIVRVSIAESALYAIILIPVLGYRLWQKFVNSPSGYSKT